MANPPDINAGLSCAYSPIAWDKDGYSNNMEIFLADELREYRSSEMMGNTFRKVDAYEGLLSKEIKEPFIRK